MVKEKAKGSGLFSGERIFLFIILIISFAAYYNVAGYDFLRWDDDQLITNNPAVKTLSFETLKHNFHNQRYTFLTLTFYSFVYKIWGNSPEPFHWLNIILHLLNVTLVFILVRKLLKNAYAVLFVTLLFALHPMRVESVAWISETKGLLYTFFALGSFIFYCKYLNSNLKSKYFLFASLLAFLSAHSKIQGLMVPFLFILFDIFYNRASTVRMFLEKIALFSAIFFISYITSPRTLLITVALIALFYFLRKKISTISMNKKYLFILVSVISLIFFSFVGYYLIFESELWAAGADERSSYSIGGRLLLSGYSLWFYLKNVIFPYPQNAVHPYPDLLSGGNFPVHYYFTLIALAAVVLVSLLMIVRRKVISGNLIFGWFFFLFNISLVVHLIPIEGRLVAADRYSYLGYLGLFVILGASAEKYIFNNGYIRRYVPALLATLTVVLAVFTYNRATAWRNTITLFNDVLEKNPEVSLAYLNIASEYLHNNRADSAIYYFNKSAVLDSLNPLIFFNRANTFSSTGQYEAAIRDFKTVIRLSKGSKYKSLAYCGIGEEYRKTGNDSSALYFFNNAIEADSLLSFGYNYRGTLFMNNNSLENARNDFAKAVELNRFFYEAMNNLGWVYNLQGDFEKALECFERSLKINPGYSFPYNNRGFVKFKKGDIAGAISDYNMAIKLSPGLIQAYLNRGWAYAAEKNYMDAINDFSHILKMYPKHQAALTNRAYAWYYLKEYNKAGNDFVTNVSNYPENPFLWQNLGWFHLQMKDYGKALEEYGKSLELDSTLINSYLNAGIIYSVAEKFAEAEKFLKKALKYGPKNPEVLYRLGELYRLTKNQELSCRYYRMAAEAGSNEAKGGVERYCR